uniref:xanthine dehydrogenase n=2 Tax=Photinus pyralis TaxID=7054 RepID=A0A1Y1MI51_PHOPY
MHGLAVTTVEGIGSTKKKIHPVQERIAKCHGTQCGFCTPGFVMSMYTLLRNKPLPKMKDLEETFQGNLCRCTGYRPIIEGFKTFTEDWELMQNEKGGCQMGDQCCKVNRQNDEEERDDLVDTGAFVPYDSTQEPIFPPELKLYDTFDRQELIFHGTEVTWHRPVVLKDLIELKAKYPKAKLVNGNTTIGIEVKFGNRVYPMLLHSAYIPELTDIQLTSTGVRFGSAVTFSNLSKYLSEQIQVLPEHETRIFVAVVDMLRYLGGKQIRNVATIGGNIANASPLSDLCTVLVAAGAVVEISSVRGSRVVTMDEHFFTRYQTTILQDVEILIAITIPYSNSNQYFHSYKQSRRRDQDTAIVNCASNIIFGENKVIEEFKIVFGGMGPTIMVPVRLCAEMVGKLWNEETLNWAIECLAEDVSLLTDLPGGMIQYRRSLTLGLMLRTYWTIMEKLSSNRHDLKDLSGSRGFSNQIARSSQIFHIHPSSLKTDTVGKPIPHISAFRHATGEAIYCDDMPPFKNELYMAVVLSTKAHAHFTMDASDAVQMEGVRLFLSAADLPHELNCIGRGNPNAVFVEKTVTSHGQVLGAIIAESQAIAQSAARRVKVTYEELEPVIISIEDAIEHKSYFTDVTNPCVAEKGNVDEIFRTAPHIIHGESRSGKQEHFYLETQCTVAVPKEDGELEVYSSTQFPNLLSCAIAHSLNLPMNRVPVIVKRLGGGFGGKELCAGSIAIPAALAAQNLGCPVRCMLDRDEDMLITGGRHPTYIKYKTAFDDDGKILATEVYLYIDGGYSSEATDLITRVALINLPNAYNIRNIRTYGYMCKTNTPSNLAFRGFGAPQAMLSAEYMIREIAEFLKKDPLDVARVNLAKEGDVTFYDHIMENCTLSRCWDECLTNSSYSSRVSAVNSFNRANRWKKRGIAVVPTAFTVGYGTAALRFAAALLHVYLDGSVSLTHSGVEMGQGLHTKMIQVASRALEIPHSLIYTSSIATDKVPNPNITSASVNSDYNGMAVLNACEIIKSRLEPYKKANPEGKWEDWVAAAHWDRVNLSTTGFYKNPSKDFDWKTMTGTYTDYLTMGVACTEVEIDCLTGDHQIIRTDIVMDVGESLNPAIDIGQIEGAFMQGYGLFMLEEFMFAPDGAILTKGPGTYKIPTLSNIPIEFNVALLKGACNPKAIYSSKGIGEPPLFLSSSVFFAVREAIKAARRDAGVPETGFKLSAPATSEVIRLACEDHLTMKIRKVQPKETA